MRRLLLIRPAAILITLASLAAAPVPAGAAFQTFTTADGLGSDFIRVIYSDAAQVMWFGSVNIGGITRFDGVEWASFDTLNSGIPGNGVYDIAEDREGRIWVGTNAGAARFDGQGWQAFGVAEGLPPGIIEQVVRDSANRMWLRGESTSGGGAVQFDGAGWKTFTTADGLVANSVSALLVHPDGNLWVGTLAGLSRYDGFSWTSYTTANGLASNRIADLAVAANGDLWIATDNGVSRFSAGSFTSFTTSDGLASNMTGNLFVDSQDRVWVGGGFMGVSVFDAGAWSTFTTIDGLADDRITAIAEDRAGFIWLSSPTSALGVSRYDGRAFETFTTLNGLGSNAAADLVRDRAGNLWLATAGGVTRYDGTTFKSYKAVAGLASDFISAAHVDTSGDLWIGTPSGLNRFDGVAFQTFTTLDGLASDAIYAISEQASGVLWVGTGAGATSLDGATWSTVGFFSDRVNAVFEDAAGNLWFGTQASGVYRFDGSNWAQFVTPNLGSNTVRAIDQEDNGNLWFGTSSGASRFDGSSWTTFKQVNGLAGNSVDDVHVDGAGLVWFATGNGLSRYDGAVWGTFREEQGLASRAVFSILEESPDVLWFGTLLGVSRFDGSRFFTFGEADGVAGPRVQALAHDPLDRLWFGTNTGLTRHEPDRVPPHAVIVPTPPALSANRLITLTYVAAFGESRGIEFQTSFDGTVRPWGGLNFFQQQGVQDGMHTFTVAARDQFGNAEPEPRTATFEIDGLQPAPQITSPKSEAVSGRVDIVGTTADLRFRAASVVVRPFGVQSWQPPAATVLYADSIPVVDSVLTTWDTNGWAEGDYELTAFVVDTLGLVGTPGPIRVTVDNLFPFVNQTAPATVKASGGNVYTTNAEVKLFFPPNAFDGDAQVRIDPVFTGVPDSLGAGIARVTPAFSISWLGANLLKASTLELNYAGATAPPGAGLALYAAADSVWTRVGGTLANGQSIISTTFQGPARYALFSEISSPISGRFLSGITLAPRVFSPRGNFSDTRLAIGFTLGQPAPVTVKIYNRAGRHVRTVSEGQTFGAGANLVHWNGLDRDGHPATEGVYIVTVEALDEKQTKTLAVVK